MLTDGSYDFIKSIKLSIFVIDSLAIYKTVHLHQLKGMQSYEAMKPLMLGDGQLCVHIFP